MKKLILLLGFTLAISSYALDYQLIDIKATGSFGSKTTLWTKVNSFISIVPATEAVADKLNLMTSRESTYRCRVKGQIFRLQGQVANALMVYDIDFCQELI